MFETLIAFHARRNPQAVILRTDSQTYTYAQFDRAIESIAAALEKQAWPRGAVALIRHHNPAVRWWLALALERLGVVFAFTGGDLDTRISIIKPDLVITDARPDRPRTEVAVLIADDAWVRDALDRKGRPTAARSQAPHDLVTLVTSSGSTGTPKVIPLSREVIDRRIAIFNLLQPDQSRALATVGEETSVGLFTPLGVWRQGGAVLMTARIDADLLRLWRPSILWVSPSHLNMMTSKFPAVFTELPDMVVEATGGAVGPALAARMENLKGARLTIAYGSTEASVLAHGPGSLLARHPGAAGYVVPWAEVQIVVRKAISCRQGQEARSG